MGLSPIVWLDVDQHRAYRRGFKNYQPDGPLFRIVPYSIMSYTLNIPQDVVGSSSDLDTCP